MTPAHYLRSLLAPRSVALIGASERPGSLGRIVYQNLLGGGFKGDLFAVNPNHSKILAQRAYPSLAAIGSTVDLAVVCAPPATVPAILAEGGGRVRAAAILTGAPTAKPAEYLRWRRELDASARIARVRVLGPASFGVIRTSLGLNATYGAVAALPGRLTLISQSGALCAALLDFAQTAGMGFASVIATGAAADIDFGELLEFALADGETDGIVLYIERIHDARAFISALRAAARTKPVVVLKAGRHAARTPPGTPGPDQVFDAALKRAGTVRVHTYTQLLAAARILASARIPRGNRVAIVTNGRGPGLMAADRASDTGIALADFSAETLAALRDLLPPDQAPGNPLDVQGEASPECFGAAVRSVLDDTNVDAVLALHVAVPAAAPTDTARAVAAAAKDSVKPILAAWLGSLERREARDALEAGGIVSFYTPENAIEALSFLAAYRHHQEWLLEVPPPQAELAAPDLAIVARVREQAVAAKLTTLGAVQTHALLAAFNMTVAPIVAVSTSQQAVRAARRIGYPVALECDDGDANGPPPRLNLHNGATLARAFAERFGGKDRPQAIVRKLVREAGARAWRISVHPDPVFGPVIAFGFGAIAPAVSAEASLMLPPLNRRLARDLIAGGREAMPPIETDPLVALLLEVSALVCALPWVVELELDPVYASEKKAVVAAARVVIDPKKRPTADGYRHLAIHPYPAELETTLGLRDGARLRVRPIRPEDATLERAFVEQLSDQSRYLRFMQQLHELTPQMLARFTQVDYDRELALIALDGVPEKEAIVGVSRYVANPDRESAEFAIAVADAWHGRGLGTALMRMLIGCAKRRGFVRLIGVVLTVNAPMLKLAETLGFVARSDPNDAEQMIVTLGLRKRRRGEEDA